MESKRAETKRDVFEKEDKKIKTKRIKEYVLEMGAHVVGIASVTAFHKYGVPKGNRPDDILKGAKSVVVAGYRNYNTGIYLSSAIETIYRVNPMIPDLLSFRITHFIENEYGYPSLGFISVILDSGLNPVLSSKTCAELAGLGTRSMAGGIILNKKIGLVGFVPVITTMDLEPDGPLKESVCPDPVCVKLWEKRRTTPCMRACSAINGKIENGRISEVVFFRQLCATRALTTMSSNFARLIPEILDEEDSDMRKYLAIGSARGYIENPPARAIMGRCIECMRVCPVNRRANKLQGGK